MKFETTESFMRDVRRLNPGELGEFKSCLRDRFIPAAERFVTNPGLPWPKALRVKDVKGAAGVWEMTWSFTDPDGRATFEWIEIDRQPAIRWRRIGSHAIFSDP